jgi:hypothetical protein
MKYSLVAACIRTKVSTSPNSVFLILDLDAYPIAERDNPTAGDSDPEKLRMHNYEISAAAKWIVTHRKILIVDRGRGTHSIPELWVVRRDKEGDSGSNIKVT